jgi:hypothetical protein
MKIPKIQNPIARRNQLVGSKPSVLSMASLIIPTKNHFPYK